MKDDMGVYCLLIAVVEQAVRDLFLNTPQSEGIMSPKYYIFEDNRIEPFSFIWICLHLDLEVQSTRKAIKLFVDNYQKDYGLNQKLVGSTSCLDYVFSRYIYDAPILNYEGVYFC